MVVGSIKFSYHYSPLLRHNGYFGEHNSEIFEYTLIYISLIYFFFSFSFKQITYEKNIFSFLKHVELHMLF